MPLGVWLSQTIRGAATAQFKGQTGPVYEAPSPPPSSFRSRAIDPDEMMTSQGNRIPSLTMDALLESFDRLSQRLEQSEARAQESIAPLAKKVTELSEQIAKTGDKSLNSDPLERAMMRITERIDRIETGGKPGAPPMSKDRPKDRTSPRRQKGFFARLFSD